MRFKVVLESEHWVVVDKPAGFHSHPPEDKEIRISHRWNAQSVAERQFGRELYPAHRLDRATSGLLLFSKHRPFNHELQSQFAEGRVRKRYYALLRGALRDDRELDEPLPNEAGNLLPARTLVRPVHVFSLAIPHPRGGERAFTLVEAEPQTGRFHQIRRHLAHLSLPIVGDTRHGDRKLNRQFTALTGIEGLFLRSMELTFIDPESGHRVLARAPWHRSWHRLFDLAGCCPRTAIPR